MLACSWSEGGKGCDGSWATNILRYLWKGKKLVKEEVWPYTADDDKFSQYGCIDWILDFIPGGITVNNYNMYDDVSIDDVKNKLQYGPVVVDMGINNKFHSYGGGIVSQAGDEYCTQTYATDTTHAVLVVGWSFDYKGDDYWIIKNSHGTDWGENGFMYLYVNHHYSEGACGLRSSMVTLNSNQITVDY